jgi:hypothetical protein
MGVVVARLELRRAHLYIALRATRASTPFRGFVEVFIVMAIYHLSAQVIGRSSGRSSVAAAAYRSGEELRDERTGVSHDYSRRRDIDSWIQAPDGAPSWVHSRSDLWNAVEAAERRKDSQVCREINVALPVELDQDRQDALVRGYVGEQFVERGMVADVAVHRDDPDNLHAHVMLTTRSVGEDGFGSKVREWNDREALGAWREGWAEHCNRELERNGYGERIDHRSHAERGLDREPTVHEGPDVREMEARGIPTERGEWNRQVLARNAERDREEERRRDPVERRADVWRGIGYSVATARALAERERDRGKEYGTDAEARADLQREGDAMHRDRWALRGEREEQGRLEDAAKSYRDASEAVERSSRLTRVFSADARAEYERAERTLGWSGRVLESAGVEDLRDVDRRGEALGAREEAQRAAEGRWRPLEGAWREIGDAMRERRDAREEREREERGDPPGTARARDMDRRLEYDR